MALEDVTSYQAKVGRVQGGNKFYMKTDGYFQFYNKELSGEQLQRQLADSIDRQIIGQGATSTALSVVNYPGSIGLVVFSMTSTMVTGAFAMVSGVKQGEEVILKVHSGSTASGEVTVTFSGCSYVGLKGSDLNSVTLHNSVASAAYLHMKSYADDEWTVIGYNNPVLCEE
jgi:hypothetical protein